MTQNTTGVPLNVTKEPQCRHSVNQDFVSFADTISGSVHTVTASCSNCGRTGASASGSINIVTIGELKAWAHRNLMLIEAPPLVP